VAKPVPRQPRWKVIFKDDGSYLFRYAPTA